MNESTSRPPVSSPGLLNEWFFEIIEPWLKGRVLEMESTYESISSLFVQKGRPIHLSTSDEPIRHKLKSVYQGVNIIRQVHLINFHRTDFEQAYPAEKASIFDTVLLLSAPCNQTLVRNAKHLLKERGRLIVFTPATIATYNSFVEDLDALRRYDRPTIKRLMGETEILLTQYYNLPELKVLVVARKI